MAAIISATRNRFSLLPRNPTTRMAELAFLPRLLVKLVRSGRSQRGYRFSHAVARSMVGRFDGWVKKGRLKSIPVETGAHLGHAALVFGSPRFQTVHSHLAAGCAALAASPFRRKSLVITYDPPFFEGENPGLEFSDTALSQLRQWCSSENIELHVFDPRISSELYLKQIKAWLRAVAAVFVLDGIGRAPFVELMIPPAMPRYVVMAQDVLPFHEPGPRDYLVTHPLRIERFLSAKTEIVDPSQVVAVNSLISRAADVEIACSEGDTGLSSVPAGTSSIVVLGSARIARYAHSQDFFRLLEAAPPGTHFVIVGLDSGDKLGSYISRAGLTFDFVEFSSNYVGLLREIASTHLPACFFSLPTDVASGAMKTIASKVMNYVGVNPCSIQPEEGITTETMGIGVREVGRILNWY